MIARYLVLGCLFFVLSVAANGQTRAPVPPKLPSPEELTQSIEKMKSLAEKGDANAQFLVGQYLEHVAPYIDPKPQTSRELNKWYEMLLAKKAEARPWYEMAAKQGHVPASYAFAKSSGPVEARRLLQYAAEQGHVNAMDALSEHFRYTYKRTDYRIDRDLPSDFGQVVLWKTRAANKGHRQAKEDLAVWYWKGLMGLPRDYQKTREYLLGAAELGLCSAMLNVGGLFFNGDGVAQSASEAQTWFAKSKECDGSDAALRKEADKYIQQSRAGNLPQASGNSGSNVSTPHRSYADDFFDKGFWLRAGIVAFIAAATLATSSSSSALPEPYKWKQPLGKCIGVGQKFWQHDIMGQPCDPH